jgi:hypothetical protein
MARWEWRTFFADALPEHLAERFTLKDEAPEESDEIYILAAASPNNVKIRHGRMDIKRLEATDRGLERWRPGFAASFPVEPRAIHAAFEAWGIPAPIVLPRRASLDEFVADVVRPVAELRIVYLHKSRKRTAIQGCAAEHTTLTVDGTRWHSIAIEDEDPDRVLTAVASLELGPRPNTSYPAALKAMISEAATAET